MHHIHKVEGFYEIEVGYCEFTVQQQLSLVMKIFGVLKKVAIEFCSATSLHGMQYTVEPRRALIERPFDDEEEKSELEQSLPTFINHLYFNSVKTRKRLSGSDIHVVMKWTDYLQKHDWSMSRFLLFLSHNCSEMIVGCKVGRKEVDCSDISRTSRTGVGFCCSVDYNIQTKDTLLLKHIPQNTQDTNKLASEKYKLLLDDFSLILNLSSQDSIYHIFYADSATIFLHTPMEYPCLHTVRGYLSGGAETYFSFKSTAMLDSPGLGDVDPLIRQCYMEDEIQLKYFDHYSLTNCIMEYYMEFLITKCNCVMPNVPYEGIYKECTIFNYLCVDLHMCKFQSSCHHFFPQHIP
ncbi:pickpocket protein 28-like isoform X2 [Nilaparvata lugens]|uniref:pickpocket protein 28-like isoform X2 n=1 Tax=Nilaparvata lugens TaxID=108931 RepID=UPI00193CFB08|nr:pickpocket protein 28-like isoform X2 [Nilaparvata lugens]